MLGDNIRTLRKQKGYSQETLAERLHIVRQTVSKWEKNLSVPDAALLQALAEVLEVSVSELLGEMPPDEASASEENEVARQLAILNDRLARQDARRRKIFRFFFIGVAVFLLLNIGLIVFNIVVPQETSVTTVSLVCSLNGESYSYEITYNDENFQILYSGGDAFISDHVNAVQYDDANVLIAQIEDYFADRGGSCNVTAR